MLFDLVSKIMTKTSEDVGRGDEGRRGKASKGNKNYDGKDDDDDESTIITDPRQQSRRLLVDLPDPHFQVDQGKIHVTRPWVNDIIMTATNRGIDLSKLKKKAVLSEEQRAERRRRRLEMEMERKKALRAAQRRLRLAKKMAADALNGESGEQKVKIRDNFTNIFNSFSSLFKIRVLIFPLNVSIRK